MRHTLVAAARAPEEQTELNNSPQKTEQAEWDRNEATKARTGHRDEPASECVWEHECVRVCARVQHSKLFSSINKNCKNT